MSCPCSSVTCSNEEVPLFKVAMSPTVSEEVGKVLMSGTITQGKKVEEFETKLKEYFHYPYLLTLNSGTAGLTLAMRLLDLQPHDEVISTALTCTATNWAILANSLDIVWADVDPETCNINLDDAKKKLTSTTRALMVVHWGGFPVDLDKVKQIQIKYEQMYNKPLYVIEDCAHAFGAKFNDQFLGTHGNICVFSLQAIKHLTCGDGGLIFLPNKELYERAKLLRWFGVDREHRSGGDFRLEKDISEWGYKFHMNDINATIGLCNLANIDKILLGHRQCSDFYDSALKNLNGITLMKRDPKCLSSSWIYSMKVLNKMGFIGFMKQKHIMTSQVHKRNDLHSCVSQFVKHLPLLDELEKNLVSIPCGWWIDQKTREYIVECVKEWSKTCLYVRGLTANDFKKGFFSLLTQLTNFQYQTTEKEFEEQIKTMNIYVTESDGKIVATGKLRIEPKFGDPVAHIEDVVVHSEFRGKNIGKYLIEQLKIIASKSACYKIVLECKENLQEFYSKCGFKKEGVEMTCRLK